ncbi:MAG TPA: preprotein translocase subunit SecE [Magnetospirillaceae bacterium]|jgi:preprotein translocase subunit SecE
MAIQNPIQFFRQVRQEVSKVTWPSRRETSISTGMVVLMVVAAAIFFMLVDQFFAWAVRMIFGLGV